MNRTMIVGGAVALAALVGALFLAGKGRSAPSPAGSPPPESSSVSLAPPASPASAETAAQTPSGPPGRLVGRVKLSFNPPRPKKINMTADPKCQALLATPPVSEELVVDEEKGVKWAFVYVKSGLEGRSFEAPQAPVELLQVGCHYEPHVLGIMVGKDLTIRNDDDLLHNVHGLPFSNKEFNFAQPRKGMTEKKTFTAPEIMVKVRCEVHPWMGAWIGVLDHPFFATTDSRGAFRIDGLPPGRYTIGVWHEQLISANREIELGPGAELNLDFTLDARP